MTSDDQRLADTIKAIWECDHSGNRILNGACQRCGCATDDYKFTVRKGDQLIAGLGGYAFIHNGLVIWYKEALYELGLLERPSTKETWRSVEEAILQEDAEFKKEVNCGTATVVGKKL